MNKQLDEADRIYHALFKKKIPPALKKRFQGAVEKLETHYPGEEVGEYYKYLQKVSDLEALELAGRFARKIPLLTDKFRIMVYLAETLPENYPVFINEKDTPTKGYLCMIAIGFRSVWKILKGRYLLKVGRS
ncbi:MAG: hypothetical protein KAW12_27200 [Candidatus Aminicenantes bacterium]|nr:hypothetical protein [Candidatus Aminicenantes bacterium]